MDWIEILQLIATTLSPTLMAILFHFLLKKWKWFNHLKYWYKQIIIGVVFAGLAICAMVWGVRYKNIEAGSSRYETLATFGSANVLPLIAGLIFGWPSGLICGGLSCVFRAGLFRFTIHHIVVTYEVISLDSLIIADSICLIMAGVLAMFFHLGLFDKKMPKWYYGFFVGLLAETLHMVLAFVTISNMVNVDYAYWVVRQADIASAITVCIALIISLAGISLIEKQTLKVSFRDGKISTKIQNWLIAFFVIALVCSISLTYTTNLQKTQSDGITELKQNVKDLEANVKNVDDQKWTWEQIQTICKYKHVSNGGYTLVVNAQDDNFDKESYGENPDKPDDYNSKDTIVSAPEEYGSYVTNGYKFNFGSKEDPDAKRKSIDDLIEEGKISEKEGDINILTNYLKDFDATYTYAMMYKTVTIAGGSTLSYEESWTQKFYVISLINYLDATVQLGTIVRMSIYMQIFIFVFMYGLIYAFLKRVVLKNIYEINDSLQKITGGDLNEKVNVRDNVEFASLSDDINQTVDTLKRYIDEANKRIDKELAFAKEIQHSALPYVFPTSLDYDLYAEMRTAKQVGGDFYDFFNVDATHVVFLVADVSGKGIPAAMFMMRAKTIIKSLAQTNELTLGEIMDNVNYELYHNNDAMMFVTCWIGILDTETGNLQYVNCGHNPVLLKQKNKFSYLKAKCNFVLAALETSTYTQESIDLKPGDEILLYTDGVTEATSAKKKLYGEEQLLNLVNNTKYNSCRDLINEVLLELDRFQKGVDQADDITMVMVKYTKKLKN